MFGEVLRQLTFTDETHKKKKSPSSFLSKKKKKKESDYILGPAKLY